MLSRASFRRQPAARLEAVPPIAPAETIEDGSTDLVVRERDKRDLPRRIESVGGSDESREAHGAEILERHRQRVSSAETLGNRSHERKTLVDEPVSRRDSGRLWFVSKCDVVHGRRHRNGRATERPAERPRRSWG